MLKPIQDLDLTKDDDNNAKQYSILQIMAGAKMGGAEAFFERLAKALHDLSYTQTILTRPGARAKRLHDYGLNVQNTGFSRWGTIFTRHLIKNMIKRNDHQIVLGWMN
ncbi:MAG: hypothetical protein AAF403_05440, partial [Pseudomonadota bacterium]